MVCDTSSIDILSIACAPWNDLNICLRYSMGKKINENFTCQFCLVTFCKIVGWLPPELVVPQPEMTTCKSIVFKWVETWYVGRIVLHYPSTCRFRGGPTRWEHVRQFRVCQVHWGWKLNELKIIVGWTAIIVWGVVDSPRRTKTWFQILWKIWIKYAF